MATDARELARSLLGGKGASPAPVTAAPLARPGTTPTSRSRSADIKEHPEIVGNAQRQQLLSVGLAEVGAPNPFYAPHEGVNGAVIHAFDRELINFSGYNYLGLAGDPRVQGAAKAAIDRYGTSCSASRLVSGQIPLHAQLEERLASAYGVDDAVVTGSGFLTNAAVIGFLLGSQDAAVCDALVHNSIVSGTRWAGCQRMNFPHNDPDALDGVLRRSRNHFERVMVIVEGVYSMDGDIARLPEIVEVARRHDCLIMVDEAHSFGVLGSTGFGMVQHFDLPGDAVDVWMGTLSKSLAAYGGYLAGCSELISAMKMAAPGINMFAAGMTPPTAAAAVAAFDLMVEEPERLQHLLANGARLADGARAAGFDVGPSAGTPIVPVILGDSRRAVEASIAMHEAGVNANPILYPAVAEGDARLRFFITAEHTDAQIDHTLEALSATTSTR